MRITQILMVACAFLGFHSSLVAGEFMTQEAVTALISGKTGKGEHLKKDFTYAFYTAPDGKLTQRVDGGDTRTGQWRVDEQGRHCVTWDDSSGVTKCFPIRDNGDGTYNKVKVKEKPNGRIIKIEILEWKEFKDGNVHSL